MAIVYDGPNSSDALEFSASTRQILSQTLISGLSVFGFEYNAFNRRRMGMEAANRPWHVHSCPNQEGARSMDPGQSRALLLHDTQKHRCWLAGFTLVSSPRRRNE